jgi:hypothetical protein
MARNAAELVETDALTQGSLKLKDRAEVYIAAL